MHRLAKFASIGSMVVILLGIALVTWPGFAAFVDAAIYSVQVLIWDMFSPQETSILTTLSGA
jgi:hypothetical protein